MRNSILYIICLVLFIFSNSCEDQVNTNAEFRERFVMSSIINCDTSYQILFLTRTYLSEIDGIDPDVENLFVHGADVKMWYNYEVYQFF